MLEAARQQDLFLPVLDALLAQQARWASHDAPAGDHIMQIAGEAGLDTKAAATQVKNPAVFGVLTQNRTYVETVGIQQTPTFFVNGQPLNPFGEAKCALLWPRK